MIAAALAPRQYGVNADVSLFDYLCAAALRGEPAPWPSDWRAAENIADIRRRLLFHGIAGLLNERRAMLEYWPDELLAFIRRESLARAMWELRHKQLVSELIEALHAAGVRSVVLKGTAYAYGLYDMPALRVRGDTDLLIHPDNRAETRAILSRLGWVVTGDPHSRFDGPPWQETWQYQDNAGFTHCLDLHWQVINAIALRHVLPLEHVMRAAKPLERLTPNAFGLDPSSAIICGAVNRAIHARIGYYSLDRKEFDPDRLAWAMDFHLLARSMSPRDWSSLTDQAIRGGVACLCGEALSLAQSRLHTPIPDEVAARLAKAPDDTPPVRFIRNYGPAHRLVADVTSAPSVRAGVSYLLARAFPAPDYLRAKYPEWADAPLLTLYLRRFRDGMVQALRGGGA